LIRRIIPQTQAPGAAARVSVAREGGSRREGAGAGHTAARLAQASASGERVPAVAFAAELGAEEVEVVAGAVGSADGVGHAVIGV